MKFKQLLLFLGACIVLVTGCNQKSIQEKKYFKGDVVLVKEASLIDTLLGEKLVMEDPAFGMIAVHDSLMFFYHPRFTDFQYYCINLNSGKLHSKYFGKGKGPNEFINVLPILQYVTTEGGDVVSPFVAINEDQYGV